jgi:DNA uptake protein ComE-like DNA-binding protein
MTVRRAQNSGIPSDNLINTNTADELININTADEAQLKSAKENTPSKPNPYAKDAFEDGTTTKLKEDPKGALININTADEAQ